MHDVCVCVRTHSVGEVVILHKCMHLKELYRGTCFGIAVKVLLETLTAPVDLSPTFGETTTQVLGCLQPMWRNWTEFQGPGAWRVNQWMDDILSLINKKYIF